MTRLSEDSFTSVVTGNKTGKERQIDKFSFVKNVPLTYAEVDCELST